MKELDKVTNILLIQAFNTVTYSMIKIVAGTLESGHLNEDRSGLIVSKEDLTAALFASLMESEDYTIKVLVGDIGIKDFCDRWVGFIKDVHDDIRKGASGELENLNKKINLVVNKLIEETSE